FDIYVNDNGGAHSRWLSNTTLRGALYLGTNGHTYSFYSVAIDVAGNRENAPGSADARTTVSVSNTAPQLVAVADECVREGERFERTLIAVDAESPPQQLTFHLVRSPQGAQLDGATGRIIWVTGEGHGDSTNEFVVQVSDSGNPRLSDTIRFWVCVRDVNTAPVLAPLPTFAVSVGDLLSVTNHAFDVDIPAQSLVYELVRGPANSGARLNRT